MLQTMHREKTSLLVPARVLQALLVLVGLLTLAFLLVEPHFEGRNARATFFQIYFQDPFLAYAYLASLAFFVGLYNAFKIAGHIGQGRILSPQTAKALRTIQVCAFLLVGFVIVGELFLLMQESDDRAGGVVLGGVVLLGSLLVALGAGRFKRNIEKSLRTPTPP
jgi:hypothetical protein